MRRIPFAILLVLAACNSVKQNCEHARDVVATEGERRAKEAIATVAAGDRTRLEQQAAKETEHLRKVFVDVCVAQPEATQKCIAKIDELAKLDRERRKSPESSADECDAPLDALMKEVLKGM